jgi:Predicted membrane protein (DUF2142)
VSEFQNKKLKSIILGFLLLLGAMITLGSWALSSPPGSGPDDEYHLSSIWCARGYRLQYCEKSPSIYEAKIPLQLHRNGGPRTIFCYAGDSKISASCIRGLDAEAVTKLESSKRFNTSRNASNFYKSNGFLVSPNVNRSILAMRLLQILFFFVLISFAIYSSGERKWAVLLALFVGMVPVGLFIIPSTSPSSWAIAGVASAGICVMNFFISSQKSHQVAAVIGFLVAVLYTRNIRIDINIMLAICVTLGLVSGFVIRETDSSLKFDRAKLLKVAFLVAPGLLYIHLKVFSLYPWKIVKFILGGSFYSFSNDSPQAFLGFLGGSIQLGSPDFAPTPVVLILMSVGLATFIVIMARFAPLKVKISSGFGLSLLFFLPYWLSIGAIASASRYVMAIYLVSLVTFSASAFTSRRLTSFKLSKSSLVTIFLTISVAQSLSLHQTIRRYITGTNISGWNLNKGAQWWWTHGPSPLSIWMIGSVAFSTALFIVLLMTNYDRAAA